MHTLEEIHTKAEAAETAAQSAETAAEAAETAANEVEPRIPIDSGSYTITQPGSYYLTENSTGRITIQADNVTLDLMGFRIAVSSGDAIDIPNGYGENTLIRNGSLRPGSGGLGVDAGYADYSRFENLRVEGNNAWCGICADDHCLVRNCDVRGCNNRGISVGDNTDVRDCRVVGGTLDGIQAESDCRIVGNIVEDHGDDGIYVTGAGTYVAENTLRNNGNDYNLPAGVSVVPSMAALALRLSDLERIAGAAGMAETVEGMVLVSAGAFRMGDVFSEGDANELPVHEVSVSEFYMDQYEVSQSLWDEVYSYATGNGYAFDNAGSGKGASHPVHTVNWYDCVKWANARSQRDGLTPVYYTSAAFTTVFKTGTGTPYPDWSADGYRLPTEAEWEKAARGGTSGRRFPWADANTIQHTRANYYAAPSSYSYDTNPTNAVGYHPSFNDGTFPYTSPVGSFAPNGYGLYDMAGNLWEWCWDRYNGSYYASSPSTNPRGPASGSYRVRRGGFWYDVAFLCRVANRSSTSPGGESYDLGFRLVRAAQ